MYKQAVPSVNAAVHGWRQPLLAPQTPCTLVADPAGRFHKQFSSSAGWSRASGLSMSCGLLDCLQSQAQLNAVVEPASMVKLGHCQTRSTRSG